MNPTTNTYTLLFNHAIERIKTTPINLVLKLKIKYLNRQKNVENTIVYSVSENQYQQTFLTLHIMTAFHSYTNKYFL